MRLYEISVSQFNLQVGKFVVLDGLITKNRIFLLDIRLFFTKYMNSLLMLCRFNIRLELGLLENRSQHALAAIHRILRVVDTQTRNLAKGSGVSSSQMLLLQLTDGLEQTTPSQLAQFSCLSQATVTSLVDKLERRGWVKREKDTTDRRRIWITVTEDGKQVVANSPNQFREVFHTRFNHLEDWEQAYILAALERVGSLLGFAEDGLSTQSINTDKEALESGPIKDLTSNLVTNGQDPSESTT